MTTLFYLRLTNCFLYGFNILNVPAALELVGLVLSESVN